MVLALGAWNVMRRYLRAFSGQCDRNAASVDASAVRLRQVLEQDLKIVLAEMAYSHLGDVSPLISLTFEQFSKQFAHAAGANEDLPLYTDVTAAFRERLFLPEPEEAGVS